MAELTPHFLGQVMPNVLPPEVTDRQTHPEVEEDTKEGERSEEAAGQRSQ